MVCEKTINKKVFFTINETLRENASSNKTPLYRKSTDMEICIVNTLNPL